MELFSFMPKQQDFWQPRQELGVVLMPYWIRQLMDRNRIDYIDILNYDKLRGLLSLEDMAQILCLNSTLEHFFLKDLIVEGSGIQAEWARSQKESNVAEYQNVVLGLAESEITTNAVGDRLRFDEGYSTVQDNSIPVDPLLKVNGIDQSNDLYRIVPLQGRVIMIVLEKGILDTLEVRDTRYKMISEYLKALYSVLPMREVSKYYGAFEHYFNML